MEKNFVKEDIIELLEVILEQSDIISNYNKQIPQIEIDIVLSNIRELYDKYKALEKLNNAENVLAAPVAENVKPEAIKIPEVVKKEIEEKVVIKDVVKPESEISKPLILPEVNPQIVIPKKEEAAEVKKTLFEEKAEVEVEQPQKKIKAKKSSVDLFSAHSTIADKFKDEKQSLNEKLSGVQNDRSIAAKLQKNPIADLKAAIGINEKFKFINELFEGNLQKYNDEIAKLNTFGSLNEAENHISLLKNEFSWKEGSEAFHELSELISRRYV
jgi:hypothetical protein